MKVHDAAFWDELHAAKNALAYSGPNPQLAAEVAHLRSGEALDAGCGDGDDAIWLAQNGWSVTATDISQVALDRAATLTQCCFVLGRPLLTPTAAHLRPSESLFRPWSQSSWLT